MRSPVGAGMPRNKPQKGYAFEVVVPEGYGATGFILADHVKSADWKARRAELIGRCTAEAMEEVRAKLAPLPGVLGTRRLLQMFQSSLHGGDDGLGAVGDAEAFED